MKTNEIVEFLGSQVTELNPDVKVLVDGSATLRDGLGLDSLDRIELISRIERQYGIPVPDDAPIVSPDATLTGIADYLVAALNAEGRQ